eukprot:CAMPEP_0182451652 /NCGR_PEP_ID=MMETSP1172-20130603/43832_1 /TAXON_ID=708627 /ORGANISM="Timspurckia oligopyrenoides, Strain CCMP3278" /LENGTH=823 /DNA_ID=CAMNT_0024649437 /DNA_START=64 /DNA_END=2534 /DNA_ORIENTATION=+
MSKASSQGGLTKGLSKRGTRGDQDSQQPPVELSIPGVKMPTPRPPGPPPMVRPPPPNFSQYQSPGSPPRSAGAPPPVTSTAGMPVRVKTARNQSDVTARRPPSGIPLSARTLTTGSAPMNTQGAPDFAQKRAPAAPQPAPSTEFGNIMRAAALPIRLGSTDHDISSVIEKESDKEASGKSKSGKGSRRNSNLSDGSGDSTDLPSKQGSKRFLRLGSTASNSSVPSETSPTTKESGSAPTSPSSALKRTNTNPLAWDEAVEQKIQGLPPTSPSSALKRTNTNPLAWDEAVEAAHKRSALRPRSAKMEIDMRRQPPLRLVPYRRNWALDPLALPHNAIRRELMDCYVMLYAMDVRREDLAMKDYEMFFGWWRVFSTFFMHYLEAEEEVLYPWIESVVKLSGLLQASKREKIKEHLKHVIVLIAKSEERLYSSNFDFEPLYVLKRAVDKVALLTQEYFGYEERTLPRIIANSFKEANKRELDKNMVNFYLKGSSPASDIVILTRWLQPDERDPKKLLEWRYDNLGPVNWTRYGVWWKTVNGKHLTVPSYFKAKRDFYKAELRQKELLQRENPDLYRKKYGRLDAEREKLLHEMRSQSSEPQGSDGGIVSSGRDTMLEAQLGGSDSSLSQSGEDFPVRTKTSPSSGSTSSAPKPEDKHEMAARAEFAASRNRSTASSVRSSFVMSDERKKELDELVLRAAKLNDYLHALDKKYGSGIGESYGVDNDDAMSLRSSQYADSVALGDELSLVDDVGYQMESTGRGFDSFSAYSVSFKGDAYDAKSMMSDLDIDLDNLSLADGAEEYDVTNLDLEQYLDFDDALSISGFKY